MKNRFTRKYKKYIKSKRWAKKRAKKLSQTSQTKPSGVILYQCDRCRNEFPAISIEIHHMTYKHLKHERMRELAVLCKNCHAQVHSDKNKKIHNKFNK
jgi:5-methylcytosine-specific restriction endonuclease McrA